MMHKLSLSAVLIKASIRKDVQMLSIILIITALVVSLWAENGLASELPPHTFTNSVGMTFIYVSPGTFVMGSPPGNLGRDLDEMPHTVTLTKGYYIQTTEVTQAQWKMVMGENPAMLKNDDRPVENVSWSDALSFIRILNQLENTSTYRLPTEAEWEYACRAGAQTSFPTGASLSTDQANFDGNHPYNGYDKGVFRRRTVKAGAFPANDWGFNDMSGNVWEWCQDYYCRYSSAVESNPTGPASGTFRVMRGGSWFYDIQSCRCASRYKAYASKRSIMIGFRVAKSLAE